MFLSRRSARFPASAYSARRSHYRPTFEALEERTLLSLSAPIITPTPGTSPAGQPVAGDFNRDGKVDLATIFRLRDGSTSVTSHAWQWRWHVHGGGRVPGRAG